MALARFIGWYTAGRDLGNPVQASFTEKNPDAYFGFYFGHSGDLKKLIKLSFIVSIKCNVYIKQGT